MNSRIAPFEALTARAAPLVQRVDADAVDVRALFATFWKARTRILIAALTVGIIVFALVSMMAPTYTAHSKIMLDTRKAQIITNNEVVADLEATEQVVNGELAVLRSNLLMQQVIAELDPRVLDLIDPALQPKSVTDKIKGGINWAVAQVLGPREVAPPVDAATAEAYRTERLVNAVRKRLKIYNEANSYVMVIRADTQHPVVSLALANAVAQDMHAGSPRHMPNSAGDGSPS